MQSSLLFLFTHFFKKVNCKTLEISSNAEGKTFASVTCCLNLGNNFIYIYIVSYQARHWYLQVPKPAASCCSTKNKAQSLLYFVSCSPPPVFSLGKKKKPGRNITIYFKCKSVSRVTKGRVEIYICESEKTQTCESLTRKRVCIIIRERELVTDEPDDSMHTSRNRTLVFCA